MKQILQNLKTGKIRFEETPVQSVEDGCLLIRTRKSLISSGTERMLLEFGKASYVEKAKQQPDRVKEVIRKIKTDGFSTTMDAVFEKLERPLSLGCSNAGIVTAVGRNVRDFKVGDRVISNGSHAEFVCVPQNLCARIPEEVCFEDAAFAVISSIGLQGIRLACPTIGETVAVMGLGLIGLLCVQLLQANGCIVIGMDIDGRKCDLARKFGIEVLDLSKFQDPVNAVSAITEGKGADAVIITASTKSDKPVHDAARMCRKRGRVILVGTAGLNLDRSVFYEKEIFFQVSCSYGPGRYDPEYEKKGNDYPLGFVRWTEKRNFDAVLQLMKDRKLDPKSLISHRFPFEEALKAYELMERQIEPYLGIVLDYKEATEYEADKGSKSVRLIERTKGASYTEKNPVIGFIGAGNFAGRILLPALKGTGARLKTIASISGLTGTYLGKKFHFEKTTTDPEDIFKDTDINTVFIATRHNSHAGLVISALKAGKHVFVEKPLALTLVELEKIVKVYNDQLEENDENQILMIGFNRRFAPSVVKSKELLDGARGPMSMAMMVNAGHIPSEHWVQDRDIGGGRIIGEACHFIDLLRFLANSRITRQSIVRLQERSADTVTIFLGFENGSMGTIHYFANGNKVFPKERLEIFSNNKILQLDNFRKLKGFGWEGFKQIRSINQDKGHRQEVMRFINAIRKGEASPIPLEEIIEITEKSILLENE